MKRKKPLPRHWLGGLFVLASASAACNPLGGPTAAVPTAGEFPSVEAPLPFRSVAPAAQGETGATKPPPGVKASPGAILPGSPKPSPTGVLGPFDENPEQNQKATTRFNPQLGWALSDQKPGATPQVSISVYQTKDELEVREARFLLENTIFRFDKLALGTKVGGGSLDIGTPPKLSLPISLTTVELDKSGPFAVFSVVAQGPGAKVHLADLMARPTPDGLSLVSLSNLGRANDGSGRHTTEYSARITQVVDSGWFELPVQATLRTRVVFVSEPDPHGAGAVAIQSSWPRFSLLP